MATRFSQYHADFLADPVRWYECETATGRPRQHSSHIVCRGVLALIDHVSLLNESQPVREMPMSLLEMHNVDPAKCVGTHSLLQRHILDDAVLSYFSGSHTDEG